MARKKKGELPSGNVRRQVFIGYETIIDENGNQKKKRIYKSITAPTAKDAEMLVMNEKLKQKHVTSDDTFKVARERFIEDMEGILSPTTIRGYHTMRNNFAKIDNVKLKNLTSEMVQDWVREFSKDHSPKTVRNNYSFISTVVKKHKVELDVKTPTVEVKETYIPSDDEIKALIDHFKLKGDKDMLIAIMLGSMGSLRRSEIAGLTADDVDGNVIHTHKSVVMDKNWKEVDKNTLKNKSSDRYITMPEYIIELLPKEGKLVNLSLQCISRRFTRAVEKLGLEHFRFHDLRHYSASVLHAIGIPDLYIQRRGGWKTDSTLKKVYKNKLSDYEQRFEQEALAHYESLSYATRLQHEN